VKKVIKSTVTNDNQLIHVLRKSGAQPVPGIDEVNFFKDDNSIIHFERPEGFINYFSICLSIK
jgi:nascent polypeptide-associated complex subunit beta